MLGALEWAEKFQLHEGKADVKGLRETDMLDRNPIALRQRLWSYLNLALAGTKLATELNRVPQLNALEACRRFVVPMRPRNDATRNAMHNGVHNPPRSKDLSTVIEDFDSWEDDIESFEKCGGS